MTPETLDNLRWVAHHDPETVTPDWLVERLDALQAELDERWLRLPLDADGKPVHVGDVMEKDGIDWTAFAVNGSMWLDYAGYAHESGGTRHVKPRTIEDVLAYFGRESQCASLEETNELLRRCAAEIRELMGVER